MNTLLAVVVVGLGSLAFRMVPLLTGRQVPADLARGAGWAGMSVIAGITVRSVVALHDPSLPLAPLVGTLAVAVGLVLAFRGRSVLLAVAAGCATYVVVAVLAGLG